MNQYREISIFVAHAYEPDSEIYRLGDFRNSIHNLIENVRRSLEKHYSGFTIKLIVEVVNYGERLPALIDQQLATCHYGIVDISTNSPNVFYELGQLIGRNVPCTIIKSRNSTFPVPIDIGNRLVFFYSQVANIEAALVENLVTEFKLILDDKSLPSEAFQRVWFDIKVPYIHVICGPELEKSEFASRESKNYLFMDNLDDKDALVEILMFVSRRYQRARLIRYASDNLPSTILEGDLVVIGGPGEPDGPGNVVCKQIMELINSAFSYSDDAEKLYYKGKEYVAAISKKGYMAKDYAYFASFPNPLNPESRVILANGIHTYGTLGATLAFSDHPAAQINMRRAIEFSRQRVPGPIAFECFFEVYVLPGGGVSCPQVSPENFSSLNF